MLPKLCSSYTVSSFQWQFWDIVLKLIPIIHTRFFGHIKERTMRLSSIDDSNFLVTVIISRQLPRFGFVIHEFIESKSYLSTKNIRDFLLIFLVYIERYCVVCKFGFGCSVTYVCEFENAIEISWTRELWLSILFVLLDSGYYGNSCYIFHWEAIIQSFEQIFGQIKSSHDCDLFDIFSLLYVTTYVLTMIVCDVVHVSYYYLFKFV